MRPLPLTLAATVVVLSAAGPQESARVRTTAWSDLAPVRALLHSRGMTAAEFPAYLDRVRRENAARVREGDLDHLVFYLLQSTRFTSEAPIEPALSAKGLVAGLDAEARARFLEEGTGAVSPFPAEVAARAGALARALQAPGDDARLLYFRELVTGLEPAPGGWPDLLRREYLRVMRFVYEKEFVAAPSGRAEAVAELYRRRGLSTDTSVEAGYLVYLGLGMLRALEPERAVRRVLIVGPGLDLAPRTGLADERPPASYQPWAVMDALLGLGLAREDVLEVVAADINPRVVAHLRRAREDPPVLTLISEVAGVQGVRPSEDYLAYFAALGRAVGEIVPAPRSQAATAHALRKEVRIGRGPASRLHAAHLDIVTGSLEAPPFDLVIATNILPYFDDVQLMLAMSNVARMLAPGGVLLHNEPRPFLGEVTEALDLRFEHSRHAVIATAPGAAAPLGDSVFIHRYRPSGQQPR